VPTHAPLPAYTGSALVPYYPTPYPPPIYLAYIHPFQSVWSHMVLVHFPLIKVEITKNHIHMVIGALVQSDKIWSPITSYQSCRLAICLPTIDNALDI